MNQKIEKKEKEALRDIIALSKDNFACEPDAEKARIALNKRLRYHRLANIEIVKVPYYAKAGSPKKGAKADGYYYQVKAGLDLKNHVIKNEKKRAGRFILATKILDDSELSDDEMLAEYKN